MQKRSKILLMVFPLPLLGSSLVVGYPMGNTTYPPPTKAFEKEDLPLLGMPVSWLNYLIPFFGNSISIRKDMPDPLSLFYNYKKQAYEHYTSEQEVKL